MAKLQLSTKVELNITEDGKVIKTFSVTFRDLTKKQERALTDKNKEIFNLYSKSTRVAKKVTLLEDEIEAFKGLEKFEKVITSTKTLKGLYAEQDILEEKFEELGGIDVLSEAAGEKFSLAIGGKDKDDLATWTEENADYAVVLELLEEDAKAKRGN